jgi:TonB family protein
MARFAAKVVLMGALLAAFSGIRAESQTSPAADPTLAMAEDLIGKSLIVRGFYSVNDLDYDATGHVIGSPKVDDWTLAGMNVQKVSRRAKNEIELDGVRVAIKFNQDSRQFERHAQNDATMRVIVLTVGAGQAEERGIESALTAIFSIGIDPALQRSTPAFWRHYFEPKLAWEKDALSDIPIYTRGEAAAGSDEARKLAALVNPVVEHRSTAKPSPIAAHDRINGEIELSMVVDAEGVPRRVSIVRPLGYGLDARAVEAVQNWKFKPGTIEGKPVAATVILREQFEEVMPQPR